jgi:hypothetical protein
MTIWILALVLLVCLAGVGYRQGAIRVAFSLIGIPIAALLSPVLSRFVVPALKALGITHPLLLWILAPFIVFIVVLTVFKVIGFTVYRKIDVYYRYKAGELRFALWERLNSRCGLALGLVNGLVYLVLISWVIYALGYWTVQIAPSSEDPRMVRMLNRMAWDLQSTGMNRVAASVDHMPEVYYYMGDVAGLIYQNSLIEARLTRYPAFLPLGERQDFQSLAKDQSFMDARLKRLPIRELLSNSQVDQMVRNPEILNLVWTTVAADVKDFREFLETGKSAKYDKIEILGRWYYSSSASIAAYRREKPNIPTSETQKIRRWMAERFAKTMAMASPDGKIVIKDFPNLKSPSEVQTLNGSWKGGQGDYLVTLDGGEERILRVDGNRMSMKAENFPVVLNKEE